MAKSVVLIGKIQHRRSAMTLLTDIVVENNVCDIIVETTLPEQGKTGWMYTTPYKENTANAVVAKCAVTGHNHTLHLLNKFRLVNVEVTVVPNGDM